MRILRIFILIPIMISFGSGVSFAQESPLVKVQACQQNLTNGEVKYNYQIINNETANVVTLWIGYDNYHGIPQLVVPPVGWDPLTEKLPGTSSSSPPGWIASVIPQEESYYHRFEWTTEDNNSLGVLPGKTMGGFSIILPNADDTYLNSNFTAVLNDGSSFSALMEPLDCSALDTTPPSISLTVTPDVIWPPNKKFEYRY